MVWQQNAQLILGAITAGVMSVVAYATLRSWRLQRRISAENYPTLTSHFAAVTDKRTYAHLSIKLDEPYRAAWQLDSAAVRPWWHKIISKSGMPIQDRTGAVIGYDVLNWKRNLSYSQDTQSGIIVIRPDAPKRFVIVFTLSLRAASTNKRRFEVRINMKQ